MDAFDSDVLIYAATSGHDLGQRVRALFNPGGVEESHGSVGVGSVLLLPELLAKPLRTGDEVEADQLARLLARLDLRPVDEATARLSVVVAAAYGLRAADAVHLATAVAVGADRFITNNRGDFPQSIAEIDITYPMDLPSPR